MSIGQEQFDKACVEYDKAVGIVKEMGYLVQRAKPEFSVERALIQFDFILQDLLIEVAFSDGEFAYVESQFIDKITDKGDVLHFIRSKTGLEVDWDNIRRVRSDKVKDFLDIIDQNLNNVCNEFALFFAPIDTLLESEKYYERLQDAISAIIARLAQADGHADLIEAEAGAYKFIKLIASRWNKVKKMTKELQEKNNSEDDSARQGSLKEQYLKKKT